MSSIRSGTVDDFTLGAHAPTLADADVDLIHHLWLDVTNAAASRTCIIARS